MRRRKRIALIGTVVNLEKPELIEKKERKGKKEKRPTSGVPQKVRASREKKGRFVRKTALNIVEKEAKQKGQPVEASAHRSPLIPLERLLRRGRERGHAHEADVEDLGIRPPIGVCTNPERNSIIAVA